MDDVSFDNNLYVGGDVSLNQKLYVVDDVSIDNNLYVGGDVSLNQKLYVVDDVSFDNNLYVGGDASFNGTLFVTGNDPSYAALDISATSAIRLPVGNTSERPNMPDVSNTGLIRYNTDTSLCEMYTASHIWSAFPVYKCEQPPKLLNIDSSNASETFTVHWDVFPEIYKDAFDGKSYPIYLQTVVDMKKQGDGEDWKTIYIGDGNYDMDGNATTPLTSITISINLDIEPNLNSNPESFDNFLLTTLVNDADYIEYQDKPTTLTEFPTFTQYDQFDFRVYGVNKSGLLPNRIDITDVGLKTTDPPGPVSVLGGADGVTYYSTSIEFAQFTFDLDSGDDDIIEISQLAITFKVIPGRN